jgi:hypothetical protein
MLPPFLEKWRYRARYQRKWVVIAALALVFLTLPFWAGPLARMVAVSMVAKRTGLHMSVGTSRVWYTRGQHAARTPARPAGQRRGQERTAKIAPAAGDDPGRAGPSP